MERVPVKEAQMIETESGLRPEGDGWFVVNASDATAMGMDDGLYAILFEGQPGA